MIPLFSTRQVRETDELAIKQLEFPDIVLMENAAIQVFNIITKVYGDITKAGFICGKGNNGGDGFAVARHFANAGASISLIYLGNEDEMSDNCKINFRIIKKLAEENDDITIKKFGSLKDVNLLANSEIII